MRKVITVNLNGNAYQVEETGYNALLAYLDGAEKQLKDNPDRDEILSDLEQAIADKCRNCLGPQKTVVTAAEIDTIIREVGPVESEAGDSRDTGNAGASSGPSVSKRLYRLREGKLVEGVCVGLSAYFGIDVNIVRVAFVLLAIASGGVGAVVYLVMVMIIPYAETPEERASAHGAQFNTQDFINQAKEHYSDLKKDGREWKERAKEQQREFRRSWHRTMRGSRYWWGPVPPPAPGPMTGAAAPIFGAAIGVLSIVWIMALISLVNTNTIFGWPVPLQVPLWIAILILILLLQAATAPLKYMRYASRYGHGNPVGGAISMMISVAVSILQMAFLVLAGWFAYTHSPQVHDFVQDLPRMWNDLIHN